MNSTKPKLGKPPKVFAPKPQIRLGETFIELAGRQYLPCFEQDGQIWLADYDGNEMAIPLAEFPYRVAA